jgi:hypothetical protein
MLPREEGTLIIPFKIKEQESPLKSTGNLTILATRIEKDLEVLFSTLMVVFRLKM